MSLPVPSASLAMPPARTIATSRSPGPSESGSERGRLARDASTRRAYELQKGYEADVEYAIADGELDLSSADEAPGDVRARPPWRASS